MDDVYALVQSGKETPPAKEDECDSPEKQPKWFNSVKKAIPCLSLFPHCKLGEGFAPFAIGSETGCILICPVDASTDVDEAALDLERAKASLVVDEPCSEQLMVLLLQPGTKIAKAPYRARGILCLSERSLVKCAIEFFSESKEQVRLGKAAYKQGRYKIAQNLLENGDVEKDADALFFLGEMYASGKGVAKDEVSAMVWYGKAAKQGHNEAIQKYGQSIDDAKAAVQRREDEIIAEIEAFTEKLLAEG